jgi:hypothetical protein
VQTMVGSVKSCWPLPFAWIGGRLSHGRHRCGQTEVGSAASLAVPWCSTGLEHRYVGGHRPINWWSRDQVIQFIVIPR